MAAIEKLDLTIIPCPPNSPDFAPCNLHLLPKIKEDRHGRLYDSDKQEEKTVRTRMKKKVWSFFRDGFQKLVHRWKKCVCVKNGGDYVQTQIQVIK
jgi:hypothetical protein